MAKKNLREKFMKKARKKVKEIISREDMFLMQVERAVEDLTKILNTLGERLEDWYSIYFPELKLKDRLKLANVIVAIEDRENIDKERLSKIVGINKANEIAEKAEKTAGASIKKQDLKYIKKLAEEYISLYKLKEFYEEEIEGLANRVAPNATYLIGGKLVAKFINHAKGLDKLAKMPASTIQVLGAEKALFKHLRNKKIKPPKHGIILLSKYVSSLPKKLRGKMARTLASKLAIAFRADATDKKFVAKELKEVVEKRYKELQSS